MFKYNNSKSISQEIFKKYIYSLFFNYSPKKTIPVVSDADSESDDEEDVSSFSIDCAKCCLFVCGLQNTSLFLIIEESAAKDKETIQHLVCI